MECEISLLAKRDETAINTKHEHFIWIRSNKFDCAKLKSCVINLNGDFDKRIGNVYHVDGFLSESVYWL